MHIYEEGVLIHSQFAIGFWSLDQLKDMYNKFNDLKKDMNLGIMFKNV